VRLQHLLPVVAVPLFVGVSLLALSAKPAPNTPPGGQAATDTSLSVSRNRPVPPIDFVIPWNGMKIFAMHAEGNRAVRGRPTAEPSGLRYYYLPLLAFQKKPSGELEVTADEDGQIALPLIYDCEEARSAVRKYLVDQQLIPADASDGQVQTVAAEIWYLETPPGYEPYVRFGPYHKFLFGRTDILRARVSPPQAQKFVRDLKSGDLPLRSVIVFDGYTYEENDIVISADDVLNTEQFKKLAGPGGKGFVGRHQVARMAREACLTRNISVRNEYQDPDFAELVKELVSAIGKKESRPVADWKALQDFFEAAGWDPKEFAADLTDAAKHIENKEQREQFLQEIDKHLKADASGSGFFGLVSADLDVETSEKSKVFRDTLSKWGIDTSWNGKQYVPKTLDVHTVNTASVRQATTFKVGKRKQTTGKGTLSWSINTKDALHPQAELTVEERLADQKRQIDRLKEYLRHPPQQVLGTPREMPINEPHTAETDGLVVAYNEGRPGAPHFEIVVEGVPLGRADFSILSTGEGRTDPARLNNYGRWSATVPVKSGQTWRVSTVVSVDRHALNEPFNPKTGTVEGKCTAYWYPLNTPAPFKD
jgi:hypothetical protein